MSDTPNDRPDAAKAAAPTNAQPDTAQAEPQAMPDAGLAAELRIAELEGQIGDLTDRLLRAHAEMDNIRKRAEREKIDTAKYAITKFARDIVGVADNFQRAMSALPADAERTGALQSLLDGVGMTEREFLNVLERNGVRRLDPKGEIFNPHLHQAVMEQMNPEVPAGTVLQVFQSGYVIEDRVLRPAMVVVASGGPKVPKDGAKEQAEAPRGEAPSQPDNGSPS
jgi:molecular chaperone GrpE